VEKTLHVNFPQRKITHGVNM